MNGNKPENSFQSLTASQTLFQKYSCSPLTSFLFDSLIAYSLLLVQGSFVSAHGNTWKHWASMCKEAACYHAQRNKELPCTWKLSGIMQMETLSFQVQGSCLLPCAEKQRASLHLEAVCYYAQGNTERPIARKLSVTMCRETKSFLAPGSCLLSCRWKHWALCFSAHRNRQLPCTRKLSVTMHMETLSFQLQGSCLLPCAEKQRASLSQMEIANKENNNKNNNNNNNARDITITASLHDDAAKNNNKSLLHGLIQPC